MKKNILICISTVLAFLALSYGFVPQVLGGKIVNQSDISGWQGMSHEAMEWNATHPDNRTAWTESMFGGMPTTTIQAPIEGDWTQPLYDLLLTGKRPATYLFISLLGAWLLMLSLGISPLVAAGGAVAVTFCSYNFQIIQVGHNTKMQAIAFFPWVLAALVFTYRSSLGKSDGKRGKSPVPEWLPRTVIGAVLFALAVSFQVKANHPQISYYLAIVILLYAIATFVHLVTSSERRKSLGRFFITSALLLVLGCAGIATNATKLIPVMEYTPYSMRGSSSDAKGLDLDYATAWSYGWEELPNMLIPNFNGGASAGEVNPEKSATIKLLRSAGQGNLKEVAKNLPLYWGPQPFTAGPMYMGCITVFLFILGLMLIRGKDKWWIAVSTLLAVLLALGSHFIAFTRLFYDFVPLYNKFRTVSMALVILQFTLPMLAFLTLDRIMKAGVPSDYLRSRLKIAFAITGGFCLVCAVFPGIAGNFTSPSDSAQQEILANALAADRRMLLISDAVRSLLFVSLAYVTILWGCGPKKAAGSDGAASKRRLYAAAAVCALVLIDLFAAGKRYLGPDDFITPRNFQSQFNKRPVDEMILEDTDPSYRVLDLTVNVFNDSHPSYWHKNIGGYSPAKLRNYQDFIESSLSDEINRVYKVIGSVATVQEAEEALPYLEGLASMNCRYIIVGKDIPPIRYRHARGNAWFEDGSPVTLTSYAPNELRYSYSSTQGGTVIFSEVYYPVGWTLTVEDTGEVLPIDAHDGVLRKAEVPAGQHSLVMRFDPPSYAIGSRVSRSSSILLLLLVLVSAGSLVLRF